MKISGPGQRVKCDRFLFLEYLSSPSAVKFLDVAAQPFIANYTSLLGRVISSLISMKVEVSAAQHLAVDRTEPTEVFDAFPLEDRARLLPALGQFQLWVSFAPSHSRLVALLKYFFSSPNGLMPRSRYRFLPPSSR